MNSTARDNLHDLNIPEAPLPDARAILERHGDGPLLAGLSELQGLGVHIHETGGNTPRHVMGHANRRFTARTKADPKFSQRHLSKETGIPRTTLLRYLTTANPNVSCSQTIKIYDTIGIPVVSYRFAPRPTALPPSGNVIELFPRYVGSTTFGAEAEEPTPADDVHEGEPASSAAPGTEDDEDDPDAYESAGYDPGAANDRGASNSGQYEYGREHDSRAYDNFGSDTSGDGRQSYDAGRDSTNPRDEYAKSYADFENLDAMIAFYMRKIERLEREHAEILRRTNRVVAGTSAVAGAATAGVLVAAAKPKTKTLIAAGAAGVAVAGAAKALATADSQTQRVVMYAGAGFAAVSLGAALVRLFRR